MIKLMTVLLCLTSYTASAQKIRIKDLVAIKGNRTNELVGMGLVVGLNASGDTPASISTSAAVKTLMSRLGFNLEQDQVITQSMAAVVVTAKLPPFARNGDEIDIKLSIVGDATSLAGGTLLPTPLKAGDGNVYAVGRGPIVVGQASGVGAESYTVASIANGGQIERDFVPTFVRGGVIDLSLNDPDFTTNSNITIAINRKFKRFIAKSIDAALIKVRIPEKYQQRKVEFISALENISVEVDSKAMVVLNERTGTVVMGGNVKISPIILSHKGLSIEVGDGQGRGDAVVPVSGITVGELLKSLNALGVQPADLISILQSIHASGALQAQLKYL